MKLFDDLQNSYLCFNVNFANFSRNASTSEGLKGWILNEMLMFLNLDSRRTVDSFSLMSTFFLFILQPQKIHEHNFAKKKYSKP